ncbi:transglutaminase domain-containing protein [Thioclava sp. BHET1]|nr:transglutaminase domain-containing protein [Thioclava sp. BHET1]
MRMTRRTLIQIGAAASVGTLLPRGAQAAFSPAPDGWRSFELTTTVTLPASPEGAQLWLPVPAVTAGDWMKAGDASWTTSADSASLETDPVKGVKFVQARWDGAKTPRTMVLKTTASTQSRAVDLSKPRAHASLSAAEQARYTAPTDLIPTDGLVKQTSDQITKGATGDLDKARRIYEWIVENTARNPKTRGCGLGDVGSMLAMGDLTGKCADLNALYVGLARAAGLPARDVYGIRVAPSKFGYKSLGANDPDVSKAQHCRAEVFLSDFGWIAVDPADVRKVMLQEGKGHLSLDDPKVVDVRRALFGAWEGNWVAYNFAHDVSLPGSNGPKLPYLMYPQAEIDGVRQDSLDPESFTYKIEARELSA